MDPILLSGFNDIRIVLTFFREIIKYEISWQTVQWEPSCYMRTDGNDKLKVAIRTLANAPKDESLRK